MSLLQRIERIHEEADGHGSSAVARVPVPVDPKPAPASDAPPAQADPRPAPADTRAPLPHLRAPQIASRGDRLHEIRLRLRDHVIGASSTLFDAASAAEMRARVAVIVDQTIADGGYLVSREERYRLAEEVIADVEGFGPLEPLLHDETITEVMVNGPDHIYIERGGKIVRVEDGFLNEEHVLRIIDRIITPIGRRIDQTSPRVDARLPDGSRVNAVIEPVSLVGPVITVRKFSARPYTVEDLVRFGTATAAMFEFLKACVEAKLNVFVSGGTGSGKTTTLNVLSSFIPADERIITIEDAAELQLRQEHVVTLESRPPNLEGLGEVTIRDLLRNALHMRPDRIIVGECRGGEALDMVQAMTVGQEGSLSTGHANSPADMLRRLETMVLMSGYELPLRSIREQIASAVDLIVHTARLKDGSRKVVNITEVYGMDDDEILTQDIFAFEQTGVRDGKVEGVLKPTGIRPTFMGKFKESGITLPPGEFGIPAADPSRPHQARHGKGRIVMEEGLQAADATGPAIGRGRAIKAGGILFLSSVGPVDPETGRVVGETITTQASQCLRNLKATLEAEGSSLEKVAWANWSLRDPAEFDEFNKEWVRWFPGDSPIGQGTLMPPLQRRAGFRVSIGVIAAA